MGESNAESVERTTALEAEYLRLRTERERAPGLSSEEVTTNSQRKDQSTQQRKTRTKKIDTKTNKHNVPIPTQHTTPNLSLN